MTISPNGGKTGWRKRKEQTTVSIVECHFFQVCTFYLFPLILNIWVKNSAKKLTLQALQYVLVIVSYHVIAGAPIHKQSARINIIAVLITDLKLMRKLEVIDDVTHDRERGIFSRCAIECEGLEGTVESPVGSINFASWFATGENYVLRNVKRGVVEKTSISTLSDNIGSLDN